MTEGEAGTARQSWLKTARTAALGFILGAALVAAPVVWAENGPAPATARPATAIPTAALLQHESFAPLVKKVLPAVVNISVTQAQKTGAVSEQPNVVPFQNFPNTPFNQFLRRFFGQNGQGGTPPFFHQFPGGPVKRIALGSGFFISPKGYVVTNNHVIADAANVVVILQDHKKYKAKIVGRDPKTDLAVLKINAHHPLPYVAWGNSNAAEVGDVVMAVGNPFGLGGTVTSGIISARGRDINDGPFDSFLQIDAPINRGNSGGPTFNMEGQVIGINTAIYSPNGGSVGIGFAIPSNEAKTIVAELIKNGKIERGWLGVQIQQVTPAIAASLGLEHHWGALVALVQPHSPASRAGLKQGDVILSFNGTPVKELRDLPRLVAAAAPHSKASVAVWRDGKKLQLSAMLGQMKNNEQVAAYQGEGATPAAGASALGMHFSPLTKELRSELHVPKNVHGVVISRVDRGSVADNSGLNRGDVVIAINQEPVHTPKEAAQKLEQAVKSPKKSALLLLDRNGVTEYVGLTLAKKVG